MSQSGIQIRIREKSDEREGEDRPDGSGPLGKTIRVTLSRQRLPPGVFIWGGCHLYITRARVRCCWGHRWERQLRRY